MWPRLHGSLHAAVFTEPMTVRNFLQADTVGVPHLLTTITVHQDVFVIIFATGLARLLIFIVIGDFEEHRRVEFSHLGALFNDIGGDDGA